MPHPLLRDVRELARADAEMRAVLRDLGEGRQGSQVGGGTPPHRPGGKGQPDPPLFQNVFGVFFAKNYYLHKKAANPHEKHWRKIAKIKRTQTVQFISGGKLTNTKTGFGTFFTSRACYSLLLQAPKSRAPRSLVVLLEQVEALENVDHMLRAGWQAGGRRGGGVSLGLEWSCSDFFLTMKNLSSFGLSSLA